MTLLPLLEVAGLSKSYGDRTVLSNLQLQVHAGEVVGLLGPNGAGKTTAIECIAGLLTPDSGEVRFAGEAVSPGVPPGARLLGIALQDTMLHERMTPLEAVQMFGHLSGVRPPADAMLERLGLGSSAHTRYDTLSGGQKQSLALALAFIANPQVILLDEPTRGLDVAARAELHRAIAAKRDDGCGLLLATHDLAEAERLCDTVAIIGAGQLLAAGRTGELIRGLCSWSNVTLESDEPLDLRGACQLQGDLAAKCRFSLRTTNPALAMQETAELAAIQNRMIISFSVGPASLEDLVLSLHQRQ